MAKKKREELFIKRPLRMPPNNGSFGIKVRDGSTLTQQAQVRVELRKSKVRVTTQTPPRSTVTTTNITHETSTGP